MQPVVHAADRELQNRKGERRENLVMRQGISLYTIAAYHEARDVFLAYCKEFPEGSSVGDAKSYLEKIDVLMSSDSPAQNPRTLAAWWPVPFWR